MATAQEPILASFIELPSTDSLKLDGLIFKAHPGNGTPTNFQPSDTALVGVGGASDYTPDSILGWLYDGGLWTWVEFNVDKGATGNTGSSGSNGTNGLNGSPFLVEKTSASQATTSTSYVNVTDMSAPVLSGRYYAAMAFVRMQSSVTTGGQPKVTFNGPTSSEVAISVWAPNATNTGGIVSHTGWDQNPAGALNWPDTTNAYGITVYAVFKPTADGTLQLRMRAESSATVTCYPGSFFRLYDLGT